MSFLSVVLLAATTAAGTLGSPTQINQRDGINLEKLSKSALDGLSEEDRTVRWAEHERVGREITDELGFEFGKTMAEYGFSRTSDQPDDPAHPVYQLPKPFLGFAEFRPVLVLERMCSVLLTRPMPPLEHEEDRQAAFLAANLEVTTNLVSVLGLSTNSLAVSTNDVPHLWRISLERWRDTQVLRIGDPELVSRLVREAKAEAEARELERIKHLMHADVEKEEEK